MNIIKLNIIFNIILLSPQLIWSQSEVVSKGQEGFEVSYGQAFDEGKNQQFGFLEASIDGKVDLGLGISSKNITTSYIFRGSYHIGGEENKAGLALRTGYVVIPDFENYFVFGPTFYANQELGDISIVPSISIEFASNEMIKFASAFGLSIFTKGQVALALRPSFVFSQEQSYISVRIGLLARA